MRTVLPITLQVVVIVGSFGRLTIDTARTIFVVHETTHTKTLIINNIVTEVNTIDSTVANRVILLEIPTIGIEKVGIVRKTDCIIRTIGQQIVFQFVVERMACIALDFSNINLGVVFTIGIHIRTLEEVDTYCGRNTAIGTRSGTVDILTIVAIAKTTLYIATNKIVVTITQIRVNPLAEISVTQLIG